MIGALLAHAGPDGGAHDIAFLVLAMPWSVVVLAVVAAVKRALARIRK